MSNETRDYQVLGRHGIPTTGVAAVVIDVAVHGSSADTSSYVTAFPSGTIRPIVSSLYYSHENAPRSNTAVVKLGQAGKISIYNHLGNTSLTVDIQGYFTTTADAASQSGGFVAITPRRVANNATGQGVPTGKLAAGQSYDVPIAGMNDIPADASAVFANIEVRNGTSNGGLKAGPGGSDISGIPSIVEYGDEGPNNGGVTLRLSDSGAVRVTNTNPGSAVNIKIDIQGYYSGTRGVGALFHPMSPTNIYSTGLSTNRLAGGESRVIPVGGLVGIPDNDALEAVAVSVNVKGWTRSGTVTVYNGDLPWPGTTTASFLEGQGDPMNGISSTAFVKVSEYGELALHNTSPGPVAITLTAQGWFENENQIWVDPDDDAGDGTSDDPATEDAGLDSIPDSSIGWRSWDVDSKGGVTTFEGSPEEVAARTLFRGSTWWDGVCTAGESRYKHVKVYSRFNARNRMRGNHAVMYCGMQQRDRAESAFGIRHIRAGHKSQFQELASMQGSTWGNWMHWAVGRTLKNAYRKTEQNETRYCYEGRFFFESYGGERINRRVIVILGKTGIRIMTAFPRNDTDYCKRLII